MLTLLKRHMPVYLMIQYHLLSQQHLSHDLQQHQMHIRDELATQDIYNFLKFSLFVVHNKSDNDERKLMFVFFIKFL